MADAVTLAKLLVELGVDPSAFTGGLDKAKKEASGFAKQLEGSWKNIGKGLGAVGAAGGVAAAGLALVVKHATSAADALSNMSAATGIGTESLQKFTFAGAAAGIKAEQIAKGMFTLQRGIANGSKETTAALSKLGLSAKALGGLMPEAQLQAVVEKLSAMENVTQRNALAFELLGKAGPILASLGMGLGEAMKRAEELGIVMSADVVAATDDFGDRVGVLGMALEATVNQFGSAIASSPALRAAVDLLSSAVGQLNQWIIANRSEIQAWVTAGLVSAVDGVRLFLSGLQAAIEALGLFQSTIYGSAAAVVEFVAAQARALVALGDMAAKIPGVGGAYAQMANNARRELAGIEGAALKLRTAQADVNKTVDDAVGFIEGLDASLAGAQKTMLDADAAGTAFNLTQRDGSAAAEDYAAALQKEVAEANAFAAAVTLAGEALQRAIPQGAMDVGMPDPSAGLPVPDPARAAAYENSWTTIALKARETITSSKEIAKNTELARAALLKMGYSAEDVDKALGDAAENADKTKAAGEAWKVAMQGVALLAGAIGGKFGEVLGVVENIGKAFEDWASKDLVGRIGAIAGAVGQIGGLIGGKTGSAIQGAAGGAMTGAAVGSLAGPVGTAVGAVVGGIAGLIGGLFGGAKREAEELAKQKDEAIKAFSDLFEQWKAAMQEARAMLAGSLDKVLAPLFDDEGQFVGGLTSAANAAAYVAATFEALRRSGLSFSQALEAIRPSLQRLADNAEAFLGTAAEEILGIFNFAEANKETFEFIEGLGEMAAALSGFGRLTQDMANRIASDMSGAIDAMVNAGLDYNVALALNAQALYNLQQAAERSGVTLDEHTQQLIDDAENAGLFEGLEDPMKKLVELNGAMVAAMGELVRLMGGQLPAAIQRLIDEFNRAQVNNPAPPPGGGAGAPGPGGGADGGDGPDRRSGGQDRVSAASGFGPKYLPEDTVFFAHAGEHVAIIPKGVPVISAAGGFGKGGDGEGRDRGGDRGGGGGGAPGPTTPTTPAPAPSSAPSPVAGEVSRQRREIGRLVRSIDDLAKQPRANVTVAPVTTIQLDPTVIRRNRQDFFEDAESAMAQNIRLGTSAIVRELRAKGLVSG
jgi:hypothetical protein